MGVEVIIVPYRLVAFYPIILGATKDVADNFIQIVIC